MSPNATKLQAFVKLLFALTYKLNGATPRSQGSTAPLPRQGEDLQRATLEEKERAKKVGSKI